MPGCRAGLGALKRKRPKLAAAGVKPVRTSAKNTRMLWRADVEEEPDIAGIHAQQQRGHVCIHLEGSGFLYRCVTV